MKTMTRYVRLAMLAFAAAATLASCEHKELCYDHAHLARVDVVIDWQQAPQADPSGMYLYLFPSQGGEPLRYEFLDREGGVIEVPYGTYDVLSFNSGTETILYRGIDAWDTFELYTRQASLVEGMGMMASAGFDLPRPVGAEEQPGALEPDMVWSARTTRFTVLPDETQVQTLELQAGASTPTYTCEIRNAENLKYASALSGSLTGMAGGFLVGPDRPTDEVVCVPFAVQADAAAQTVTARFHNFGANSQQAHQLVVYAILADGSKWYYTYDVSDQIRQAPDPLNVHIVLDGLPLPKPITNGSGMHPSVDDWENVEVDIEM